MPVCVTVLNSSGRNGAAGVVPVGDRPRVMLAPVEEPNTETEDWIWNTGAALDVASAAVAGKRQVSFTPLILGAGDVVNSVESVVVKMAEIGGTVKEAVLLSEFNDQLRVTGAAAVEGEVVEFPEVDADRKDEATLRDVVVEEVLVPSRRSTSDRAAC